MKTDCFLFAGFALLVAFSACSEGNNSSLGPSANEGSHPNFPTALLADTALASCVRTTAALNGVRLDSVGLASLRELAARGKGIASLEGIGVLRNLRALDLSANQITDLSPLEDLDSLRELDLSGNQISDLTPLAALARLEIVLLQDNLIRDPSPLLRLTNLIDVDLTNNPMEMEAQTPLAALADRGVNVIVGGSQNEEPQQPTASTRTLAFSCWGSGVSGVYLVDYPETGATPLVTEAAQYGPVYWSPDGMTLAFSAKLTDDSAQRIYLVPRTGGQVTHATAASGIAGEGSPCWSPNGDRLAFVRTERDPVIAGRYLHDVYIVTVATGAEQRLTRDGTVQNIVWGPTDGTLTIQHDDQVAVSLLNPIDGSQIILARGAQAPDNKHRGGLYPATWSPEGTRLLLIGHPEGATAMGIYMCQPPAPPELVVADTDSLQNGYPSWSPDGTDIVFCRFALISKGKPNIWRSELAICHLPTRTVEIFPPSISALVSGGIPQWSPDGTLIAFDGKSPSSNYRAVFTVSLADNNVMQLTDESTPDNKELAWAPR